MGPLLARLALYVCLPEEPEVAEAWMFLVMDGLLRTVLGC